MIYITPLQGGRWVLYDHRLAPMVSEGYLDPADTMPVPGLSRLSPSLWDPFGLWIRRKPKDIPWRYCPQQ
eukprot:13784787-Heterocapsa_arctica.AAC.1